MKVLFVHSSNFSYGIESFIKSQGESLKEEGIEIAYYPVKGKGINGYLGHIKRIKKISQNFDIIHAHYGLIGLLCALSFTGKPLVLSVMGSDAYGSYNIKGKRLAKSYFIMFLTQVAMLKADAIIAKSNNIYKYIPYKSKSEIIPNGVNFSLFRPMAKDECRNKLNIQINSKVLLSLVNPKDPRKNFSLVQKAAENINYPEFELINPFPIKHEDIVYYLNACDAFILTSYNEGSPNVIKEAMACNIPIISTKVGDVDEIIGNTDGCYLADFDAYDVSEKIKMAISLPNRTSGRKDIASLDAKLIAQKIIKIYREIV